MASLFFPAFYIDRSDYDAYADGKWLALLGWMSILGGGLTPFLIWLANPLFSLAVTLTLTRSSRWLVLLLSSGALAIALSFSTLEVILTSERPEFSKITSLEAGYYLWVSSMAVLVIGTLSRLVWSR
jgi:hypothetical protein